MKYIIRSEFGPFVNICSRFSRDLPGRQPTAAHNSMFTISWYRMQFRNKFVWVNHPAVCALQFKSDQTFVEIYYYSIICMSENMQLCNVVCIYYSAARGHRSRHFHIVLSSCTLQISLITKCEIRFCGEQWPASARVFYEVNPILAI